jgi:hypothetical protein
MNIKKGTKTLSLKDREQECGYQRVSDDFSRYVIESSAASSEIDDCPFDLEYHRQQSLANSNFSEIDQNTGL